MSKKNNYHFRNPPPRQAYRMALPCSPRLTETSRKNLTGIVDKRGPPFRRCCGRPHPPTLHVFGGQSSRHLHN